MVTTIIIVLAVVLAVIFWITGMRNRLTALRGEVQQHWSQVDLHLQERDGLLRSLLQVAGDYANAPKELLTEAHRTCEMAAAERKRVWERGGPVQTPLGRLRIAEQSAKQAALEVYTLTDIHTDLRQSKGWQEAAERFQSCDKIVNHTIETYNLAAKQYNDRLTQGLSSWIARGFRFQQVELFQVARPTGHLRLVE